jgi:3-hydroxymyristoyl/3-hydroxydecanoyl-(acyl carrier protein) dehydratase
MVACSLGLDCKLVADPQIRGSPHPNPPPLGIGEGIGVELRALIPSLAKGVRVGGFFLIAAMHFLIPSNHPSLPGHFPRHPIVPGVVILNHVVEAVVTQFSQRPVVGLQRVKFLAAVLPDQLLRLELDAPRADRVAFKCWLGEQVVLSGQALLAGSTPAAASG